MILLVGIFFLNESPRWLMEKDRHEEALAVLQRLRSGEEDRMIELEFREIRDLIIADRAAGSVS
ncbi:MFS transporter [Candidatus Bathyarchaeota archaeon]|nr:MFS transporter [Candidatus Bathyarchaeota archaeon]